MEGFARLVLAGVIFAAASGAEKHRFMTVSTAQRLKAIVELSDFKHFMHTELPPFMRVRVPGTDGVRKVRDHIVREMRESLSARWHVELDTFTDSTPFGNIKFSNIIATLDPNAPRRLTLACHYDSKFFEKRSDGRVFIGATDSAVPCAQLLNLARTLDGRLKARKQALDVTLQLLFFDGEEALQTWTNTDSLYGSRHLASVMESRPDPTNRTDNELKMMDALILLDLIGASNPAFYDHFDNTSHVFKELVQIEKRLSKKGLLLNHKGISYFKETKPSAHMKVEDDHVPFLRRGVPCVHLISIPFPDVWHTVNDDGTALHRNTIENLNRIFRVFLVEYLHL